MTITSNHTQACFNAWMNCESLLQNLTTVKTSVSKKITQVIDECAIICQGTFSALKTGSTNLNRFALLCVGICEECAELLEAQADARFQQCAVICRQCSESLSHLAFPAAILQIAEPQHS
jgi:hypothetical protein